MNSPVRPELVEDLVWQYTAPSNRLGISEPDRGPIRVLLVEDNPGDVRLLHALLLEAGSSPFELLQADRLSTAMELIDKESIDLILLDLSLPDGQGLDSFTSVHAHAPGVAIVVLTGLADESVATQAVREGAQDYLVKGQVDSNLLVRSMRYAIERKRLEEQLAQSQKIEAIGRLAGGIAHDFNNLLTAITSYAYLGIAQLAPEDGVIAYLQEIQRAADRAAQLTQQLLAFSRRQIIQPVVLNLNDLILNLHGMLRRIIREDTELVTLLGQDIGPVRVDPGQIEQVLINLVVNARDAMPNGGKLFIETAVGELNEDVAGLNPELTSGSYVVIAVKDTGTGITEKVKRHIFEPFFTTKKVGKGTGLGLSSCYGIVAQSGGYITVDSEPGSGTTFRIYLPQAAEEASNKPKADAGYMPTGTETVLVVEDEPSVRSVAAQALLGQGYTVLEAANGVEAMGLVTELRDETIHLMLTDVVMPLMGGTKLARHIRVLLPEIRVLYTSGYNDDAVVRQRVKGDSHEPQVCGHHVCGHRPRNQQIDREVECDAGTRGRVGTGPAQRLWRARCKGKGLVLLQHHPRPITASARQKEPEITQVSEVRNVVSRLVREEPVSQGDLEDAQVAFDAMYEQASERGLTMSEVVKAVFKPVFEYKRICECPSCVHRRAAAGRIPMDAVRSAFPGPIS